MKKFFSLKIVDKAFTKKVPSTQYIRRGWHEKALFAENAEQGWYKKAFITQYVKWCLTEKAVFAENAR